VRAAPQSFSRAPLDGRCGIAEENDVLKFRRRRGSRICGLGKSLTSLAWMIVALLVGVPAALSHAGAGPALKRISLDDLRVTNGAVTALRDGVLVIETPSSRAVVRSMADAADQAAEIRFRYLGASQTDKPLASGELRRQIGLKLRAADSCNVVYVMWHIAPDSRIAVSVKRNAGHSHAQCGAHGYQSIAPQRQAPPRPIRPGEVHTLRAELRGRALTVTADGKLVWRGTLADQPPAGPPGFRTDNARFVLEYFARDPGARFIP
jgi:hypothetical protein